MANSNIPLLNPTTWIRFVYMVIFTVLLGAARFVVFLVVVLQFLLVLIAGKDNEQLRNLGQGLGKWIYQSIMFLTFNSEKKPFPFDEWPEVDVSEGYSVQSPEQIEEAEYVEAEEVVDDSDVPSFTASKENDQASDEQDKT